jgi:cell division ATPase FtsA
MPVRLGIPINVKGIIDEVQHPAFSTVIGLAIYSAANNTDSASSFGFGLPKGAMLGTGKIFKKLMDIIKSFIP